MITAHVEMLIPLPDGVRTRTLAKDARERMDGDPIYSRMPLCAGKCHHWRPRGPDQETNRGPWCVYQKRSTSQFKPCGVAVEILATALENGSITFG